MPSKSPFGPTFKSAIMRGTPCFVVVNSICQKTGKSPSFVFKSLCNAGLCWRQKFNGSWIYFPTFGKKSNATNTKLAQCNLWQCFIDWCVCSGCCTPKSLKNHCGPQNSFMNFCKKHCTKPFTGTSTGATTKSGKKSKPWSSYKGKSTSYKFGKYGKSTGRKYRKAA